MTIYSLKDIFENEINNLAIDIDLEKEQLMKYFSETFDSIDSIDSISIEKAALIAEVAVMCQWYVHAIISDEIDTTYEVMFTLYEAIIDYANTVIDPLGWSPELEAIAYVVNTDHLLACVEQWEQKYFLNNNE